MRACIFDALEEGRFAAILCEETSLLINIPCDLSVPLIIDHHNVEYRLFERYAAHAETIARGLYARLEARFMRNWEASACARASVLLTCSDEDRRAFERMCTGSAVVVAPNVIDVSAYTASATVTDEKTVLYAGGMDWYPNRDAVRYFVENVLPVIRRRIPCMQFVIAGRGPSAEFAWCFRNVPGIRFTGTVADMRSEISQADVIVVPLRIGSGTRLKILEAAAMAKPVVSTTVGAEGLAFSDGIDILIADDPETFGKNVADLLEEPQKAIRLGLAARRCVERNYTLGAMRSALRIALAHEFGPLANAAP